jgi:hypothetical protein
VLRALASTQNDFFFLSSFGLLLAVPNLRCRFFFFFFFFSNSIQFLFVASRLGGHPSGAAAAAGGAVQLTPARVAPPGLAAIRCNPDSLPLQNSSSHVRGSRGPRGLGFMALVNPWRAVPRSPCRFFFNAR